MGASGSEERTMFAGQSLNDDVYHTVVVRRRGNRISAAVDDDQAVEGEENAKDQK